MTTDELFPEDPPAPSPGEQWLAEQRAAELRNARPPTAAELDQAARNAEPRTATAVTLARSALDLALERVDSTDSDAAWKREALRVVAELAAGGDFTTDDVWHRLEELAVDGPHDGRALGPIMQRATRFGIAENTGVFTRSTRRHLAPIPIWRSPT